MKRAFVAGLLLSTCVLAPSVPFLAAEEDRHADHEELRAMLRVVKEAFDSRQLDRLQPILDPSFSITTVDQRRITSLADLKAYWNGLFEGEHAMLKSVTLNPDADELTRFLSDDTGVVYGSSADTYVFTDGDTRTMKIRWSATVHKSDGHWKLVSAHVGANFLDNPAMAAARQGIYKAAGGGLAGGLVLGAIGGVLVGRRRKS